MAGRKTGCPLHPLGIRLFRQTTLDRLPVKTPQPRHQNGTDDRFSDAGIRSGDKQPFREGTESHMLSPNICCINEAQGECRPLFKEAVSLSRWAHVGSAVSDNRMRALPSGTVGGRMAVASIPLASRKRDRSRAFSSLPTITGIICVLESAVSQPA